MPMQISKMQTDGMILEIMRLDRQYHTNIHQMFRILMDMILITMHGMM